MRLCLCVYRMAAYIDIREREEVGVGEQVDDSVNVGVSVARMVAVWLGVRLAVPEKKKARKNTNVIKMKVKRISSFLFVVSFQRNREK